MLLSPLMNFATVKQERKLKTLQQKVDQWLHFATFIFHRIRAAAPCDICPAGRNTAMMPPACHTGGLMHNKLV